MRTLFALLLLFTSILSLSAIASSENIELSYFIDESESFDEQSIVDLYHEGGFTSLKKPYFWGGFVDKPVWFRVSLNPSKYIVPELLLIRTGFLSDFLLFEGGTSINHITPEKIDFGMGPEIFIPCRPVTLMLKEGEDYTKELYIKVSTPGLLRIGVSLETQSSYLEKNSIDFFFKGTVIGILLFAVMLILLSGHWVKEGLAQLLILFIISYIFLFATSQGLLSSLFPVALDFLPKPYSVLPMMLMMFSIIAINHKLLKLNKYEFMISSSFIVLALICIICFIVIENTSLLKSEMIFLIGAMLFWFYLSIKQLKKHEEFSLTFTVLTVFQFLYTASILLNFLGLKTPSMLELYWPTYGFFILVMFYVGLLISQQRAREKRQLIERRKMSELEDSYDRQAEFLSMLRHELKTPLSAIKIVFGLSNPSDKIKKKAMTAVTDIDNLLDRCAHIELIQKKTSFDIDQKCPETVLLSNEIKTIVEEFVELGANIKFQNDLKESAHKVPDKQLFVFVLRNLIDNAFKYNHEDSQIFVRLFQEKGNVWSLSVTNQIASNAMPDEEQLYSKYYRAPAARRKTGAGLGLYISRIVCDMLGLKLDHSIDGQLISFSIRYPSAL